MKAKRGRRRKLHKTNKNNKVKQNISTTNKITTEKEKYNNVIYSKNSIQFRNDHIVHIVTHDKKSLDKNTDFFIRNKNLKINAHLKKAKLILLILKIENYLFYIDYVQTTNSQNFRYVSLFYNRRAFRGKSNL